MTTPSGASGGFPSSYQHAVWYGINLRPCTVKVFHIARVHHYLGPGTPNYQEKEKRRP